ncbi:hypothetical protein RUND412_001082 [Rhizina undulata]
MDFPASVSSSVDRVLALTVRVAHDSDFKPFTQWKKIGIPMSTTLSEFTVQCNKLFNLPTEKNVSKIYFRVNSEADQCRLEIVSETRWEFIRHVAARRDDFSIELLVRNIEVPKPLVWKNPVTKEKVASALGLILPLDEFKNFSDLPGEIAMAFERSWIKGVSESTPPKAEQSGSKNILDGGNKKNSLSGGEASKTSTKSNKYFAVEIIKRSSSSREPKVLSAAPMGAGLDTVKAKAVSEQYGPAREPSNALDIYLKAARRQTGDAPAAMTQLPNGQHGKAQYSGHPSSTISATANFPDDSASAEATRYWNSRYNAENAAAPQLSPQQHNPNLFNSKISGPLRPLLPAPLPSMRDSTTLEHRNSKNLNSSALKRSHPQIPLPSSRVSNENIPSRTGVAAAAGAHVDGHHSRNVNAKRRKEA